MPQPWTPDKRKRYDTLLQCVMTDPEFLAQSSPDDHDLFVAENMALAKSGRGVFTLNWPLFETDAQRSLFVKNEMLEQTLHRVDLYVDRLSDDLLPGLSRIVTKSHERGQFYVGLNILCDTPPDPDCAAYRLVAQHINQTQKGGLTVMTAKSHAVLTALSQGRHAPHVLLSDSTRYVIDLDPQDPGRTYHCVEDKDEARHLQNRIDKTIAAGDTLIGNKPPIQPAALCESLQWERTIAGLLPYNRLNLNICNDDIFTTFLNRVRDNNHYAAWDITVAERATGIRNALYADTKNEICVYAASLDEVAANMQAAPLAKHAALHVLCDEKPALDSPAYAVVSGHIAQQDAGFVAVAGNRSRNRIGKLFTGREPKHFTLADGQNYVVDRNDNGSHIYAGFGKNTFDVITTDMRKHFLHAAARSEGLIGHTPKGSLWDQAFSKLDKNRSAARLKTRLQHA